MEVSEPNINVKHFKVFFTHFLQDFFRWDVLQDVIPRGEWNNQKKQVPAWFLLGKIQSCPVERKFRKAGISKFEWKKLRICRANLLKLSFNYAMSFSRRENHGRSKRVLQQCTGGVVEHQAVGVVALGLFPESSSLPKMAPTAMMTDSTQKNTSHLLTTS